ncbi:MAG: hypothetical protein C0592_08920 [Marinilabiliales bacterium]|nr:MAG: hypothetical protein C0592_08920 [Marinilabiliales bacterium]
MAKRKYQIDNDPSKELMFRWNAGWRSTEVYWNQEQIAVFDKNQTMSGVNLNLPDGKNLDILLIKGIFTHLVTKIDGKHIPNSMGDPQYTFRQIFLLLLVLGIINIGVGLAFFFLNNDAEIQQLGIINAAMGGLQILIGYGVMKNLFPALITAVIFMGADLVLTAISWGGNATSGGVFMKLFFLIFIFRGFSAFKEKKRIENENI